MRMEEGFTPGGYRYRTRSRTGSLGCGKLMPPSSESKRGKNEVISETEAGDGDGTVKSAAQCGSVKIGAQCGAVKVIQSVHQISGNSKEGNKNGQKKFKIFGHRRLQTHLQDLHPATPRVLHPSLAGLHISSKTLKYWKESRKQQQI